MDVGVTESGRLTAEQWHLSGIDLIADDAANVLGDRRYDVMLVDPRSGLSPW